jgi:RHS repeat-associated protein
VHSEARYYPYGVTRWSSGTLPTDYRFTGQREESGLGLYQMGARWYDAYISRWISPDTIIPDYTNPQSLNRFSYTLGNPLKYVDTTGHKEEDACGPDDQDCWIWDLSDPTWYDSVADPYAAEQAFLLFLKNPAYYAALYTDPAAWASSQDVANLDVFLQYSIFHMTANQLVCQIFEPDTAEILNGAHVQYGAGNEVGANDLLIGAGIGVVGWIAGGVSSASDGILLNRSLASAQQMGERGFPIAGAGSGVELRVAKQLAVDYGGSPGDWAKMVSSSYCGADGYQFETHWYENIKTGLRVEWKTKLTGGWWRGRR